MLNAMSHKITGAIVALAYFLLPFAAALAHEGEENITVLSEADWVGPLAALVIIAAAVAAARTIKKKR